MSSSPSFSIPPIDERDLNKIILQFKSLAQFYIPEISFVNDFGVSKNSDFGTSLAYVFASILQEIVSRLNKLPEKNFIEFLNILNLKLNSITAASTEISFYVNDNAKRDIIIPLAIKTTADANNIHPELTFESQESILATRSNIVEILSTITSDNNDIIFSHSKDFNEKRMFFFFSSQIDPNQTDTNENDSKYRGNIQQHVLYLGCDNHFFINDIDLLIDLKFRPLFKEQLDILLNILQLVDGEYSWKFDPSTGIETENTAKKFKVIFIKKDKEIDIVNIQLKINGKNDSFNINDVLKNTVNDVEDRWIRLTLPSLDILDNVTKNYIQLNGFPLIKDIQIVNPGQIVIYPDLMFYNDIPLIKQQGDGKFYPFGKRPVTYDIFYISSNYAFSQKGQKIKITFKVSKNSLIHNKQFDPLLSWEYWNGQGWYGLVIDIDKDAESVSFICPEDLSLIKVNGNENYWIRIRIASGDYGRFQIVNDQTTPPVETSASFSWILDDTKIQYPELIDVIIELLDEKVNLISNCIKYNNLEYVNCFTSASTLSPFTLFDAFKLNHGELYQIDSPCIYIGFDKKMQDGPISIFFSLNERNINIVNEDDGNNDSDNDNSDKKLNLIDIFYISSTFNSWKNLDFVDNTEGLTKSGKIKLFFPSDFQNQVLFGKDLFWIKIVDINNRFYSAAIKVENSTKKIQEEETLLSALPSLASSNKSRKSQSKIKMTTEGFDSNDISKNLFHLPEVNGIFLNTVFSLNATKIEDEILGTSNGLSNQVFNLSKIPIVINNDNSINTSTEPKVWINEGKDSNVILDNNNIQLIKDTSGNTIKKWILWQRVDNFYLSTKDNRHYVLDTITGILQFGDGINGMIPPIVGPGNIKANYYNGGGSSGNINENEVKTLKSFLPSIDKVVNNIPAHGGLDQQSISNIIENVSIIRNRGQAVTSEDFESIIYERFPSLAKVKCLPVTFPDGSTKSGWITIVIVPYSSSNSSFKDSNKVDIPRPSIDLLNDVQQYISPYSSNVVISLNHCKVISPIYIQVSIQADIYLLSSWSSSPNEVKTSALENITEFLDPINGGLDGKGWEFGKIICYSDIYYILQKTSGVQHVEVTSIKLDVDNRDTFQIQQTNTSIMQKEKIKKEDVFKISNKKDSKSKPLENCNYFRKSFFLSPESDNAQDICGNKIPVHSLMCNGQHKITIRIDNNE